VIRLQFERLQVVAKRVGLREVIVPQRAHWLPVFSQYALREAKAVIFSRTNALIPAW